MIEPHTPRRSLLWWEGVRCGLRNIGRLYDTTALRHAVRLLLCPVDLWRYAEFPAVLGAWHGESPVLDIASPKLLSLMLARRHGAHVIPSDIVPHVGDEVAAYARSAEQGVFMPCVFDARALPFADYSLPFVYSVSALEHIGGNGDSQALAEIGRVLAPDGTAVVTVPAGPEFREVWLDRDPYGRQPRDGERVFFSYIYDRQALEQRLIMPSGLRLDALQVWADTPAGWYETRYVPAVSASRLRAALTKLCDPWFARRHIRTLPQDALCMGRGIAILILRR